MPFTEEFNKVRRHFSNLYNDKARAETFAFQEAFKKKIPTFESRKKKFKKQIRESLMFTEV